MAAEGFSLSKAGIVSRVIRNVEATGDPVGYTTDLTKLFFADMREASVSFLDLFAAHKKEPAIIGLLLGWAHGQITAFAAVLSRQIHLALRELSTMIIIQLRSGVTIDTHSSSSSLANNDSSPSSGWDVSKSFICFIK